MSMEAIIFAALKDLTANRAYPDVGPQGVGRPYITYQQVGGEPVNFIDSTVPNKKNARVQVNVWADSRLEAATIARQIEDVLRGTTALQTTVLGSFISVFEPDTKLYGTIQDFSFWI